SPSAGTPRRQQIIPVSSIAKSPPAFAKNRTAPPPSSPPPQQQRGVRPSAPSSSSRLPLTQPSAQKRVIRIEDHISLQQLAQRMSVKATDVLTKLITLGVSNVNINSTLDFDIAKILASEFGYEVENVSKSEEELIAEARGPEVSGHLVPRPPVVTVMGHVDHGKTTLLDRIRKSNVAASEAGGITQHIGAYRVETPKGPIVFLDTPGHEAFTSMRARGAQATDIVVLVVAADDGVMPQTREAIDHARAAKVPIVVAINKIDKPDARPEQVKNELAALGLTPEEWGGDTLYAQVSALTGKGIDQLLEQIVLQAELLELRANPEAKAKGVVLEAYIDKGRGVVANVLVQDGTLHQGDLVLAGIGLGRIRAMSDEKGRRLKAAGPSTPVEILGLSDMPSAGDLFTVVADQRKAQEIVELRKKNLAAKEQKTRRTLADVQKMLQTGEIQELNLVVKTDVQGTAEALVKALTELSTEKVRVQVISWGVGGITESDVMLASASKAIIVGFNAKPTGHAAQLAKSEGVEIRNYSVIYDVIEDMRKAMLGLLAPVYQAKDIGKAEVRKIFHVPKVGTVAGCYVLDGVIRRSARIRVIRDGNVIWEGNIAGLKRLKDDVREVSSGFECGVALENFQDIKENDILECYEMEQVSASLS
ncbi:MAG: translation initiation factor IF-2, partial [Sandaracinaceae bacterium]|nr:translation initiation factor IF-2 [Sandaracinaceae bacterium]